MAKYTVTYYIKSGGREHECDMQVEADNAAEACKLVKDIVKEESRSQSSARISGYPSASLRTGSRS